MNPRRLKLQENPEMVPTGEVPRHVDLCVENMLVGTCKPGSRVTVVGIFSIYQAKGRGGKARIGNDNNAVAIRNPYLRVLHIDSEVRTMNQHYVSIPILIDLRPNNHAIAGPIRILNPQLHRRGND
eukprot:1328419-Amorphochlora_amoeboformis.AAC.2